jgi:Flp pilus assembly protein TadD
VAGGLTLRGIAWAFTATSGDSFWHPLTWLSLMVDVELFGLAPGPHHLVSAAIHAANAAILFLALRRMTGATWRSAFAAALFAVHPLHVESVAWASERKDLLSTFFFLLALLAYAGYAARPRPRAYAVVVLCFALSLMSKPMMVTFPFVLLLLDGWPLRRTPSVRWPTLLAEKVPLLLMAAGSAAVTLSFGEPSWAVPLDRVPLGMRLANAALAYAGYLSKTVWPVRLAVFYPHPATLPGGIPWLKAAGSFLLVAAATAAVLWQARRRPWLAAGWFFFLGTLVPVIGLVQVGGQGMADRFTYVPLIGIFVAAAWGGSEVAARMHVTPFAKGTAAAVTVALLAAVSWRQLGYWRSTETLFNHALEATGENWVARAALGTAALESGRNGEAVAQLTQAIRLAPDAPALHNNLGQAFDRLGRGPEARAAYEGELRIYPASVEARYNLGNRLLAEGRPTEAAAAFRELIRRAPGHAGARRGLGLALGRTGAFGEAVGQFREAVRLEPRDAESRYGLGLALARTGATDEAIDALRESLALRPGSAETFNSLGALLAEKGRTDEAARLFREALRLDPGHAGARRNLEKVLRTKKGPAADG